MCGNNILEGDEECDGDATTNCMHFDAVPVFENIAVVECGGYCEWEAVEETCCLAEAAACIMNEGIACCSGACEDDVCVPQ